MIPGWSVAGICYAIHHFSDGQKFPWHDVEQWINYHCEHSDILHIYLSKRYQWKANNSCLECVFFWSQLLVTWWGQVPQGGSPWKGLYWLNKERSTCIFLTEPIMLYPPTYSFNIREHSGSYIYQTGLHYIYAYKWTIYIWHHVRKKMLVSPKH